MSFNFILVNELCQRIFISPSPHVLLALFIHSGILSLIRMLTAMWYTCVFLEPLSLSGSSFLHALSQMLVLYLIIINDHCCAIQERSTLHSAFSTNKTVRVFGEVKARAYWEKLFRGLAPRGTKFPV